MKLLGQVPEGSGADAEVRFLEVPVQRGFRCTYPGQVQEGSGADNLGEVQEGSSADTEVKFRNVPVQMLRSGSGRYIRTSGCAGEKSEETSSCWG